MEASRILLDSLVEALVPEGAPLVVDVDETMERRQGKRVTQRGSIAIPRRRSGPGYGRTPRHAINIRYVGELPLASRPRTKVDSNLPSLQ
jgi:hypothetical protein